MSVVTFIKQDSTTQGTWYNGTTPVYGADGYEIIGNGTLGAGGAISISAANGYWSPPAYAALAWYNNPSGYQWQSATSNKAGVEYAPVNTSTGSDTKRIIAAAYSTTTFSLDVNLTDGNTHQVAVYCQDFDNNRTQTIKITDDNNAGAVLYGPYTLSNFGNGVWFVFNIKGKVSFVFNCVSGSNCVCNAVMFDPAAAVVSPAIMRPMTVLQRRFEPAFYE